MEIFLAFLQNRDYKLPKNRRLNSKEMYGMLIYNLQLQLSFTTHQSMCSCGYKKTWLKNWNRFQQKTTWTTEEQKSCKHAQLFPREKGDENRNCIKWHLNKGNKRVLNQDNEYRKMKTISTERPYHKLIPNSDATLTLNLKWQEMQW